MAAPRISLCMIVRDEEEFLGACLDSAACVADEICVVDTGSADRSVAIAEARGARVGHFDWNDSFADARNASLAMARGDWILVLDADEELQPEAGPALRALAADTTKLAALLALENEGEEGHAWVQRFFRNHPEHRYAGAVHEQLGEGFQRRAAARGRCIAMCDAARIRHRGYAPDVAARRHKARRMRRLYGRAVSEGPDDVYLAYKHAEFLRGEADPEALAAFERAAALVEALPESQARRFAHYGEIYALQAATLLEAGRLAAAGSALDRGFALTTPTAHLHFVEGLRRLREARFSDALSAFRACRDVTGPARIAAPLPGVTTWKSALGMAEALAGLGRVDEALVTLRGEIEAGRGEELASQAALRLAARGCLGDALRGCSQLLAREERAWAVWNLSAALLRRAGRPEIAQEAERKARQWHPAAALTS